MAGAPNLQELQRPIEVRDEGLVLARNIGFIDFVGAVITATAVGNNITVNNSGGSGSGAVDSVFGRTGVVVAVSGDYNTSQVSEHASYLYYTQARFDTAFAAKSTTNLSEGTNLYWTQTRFNTAFAAKNTDGLTEGSTNKYFTTANVTAAGLVVGPASATDNAVTRYDGTTGKIIQNSTATIGDNGALRLATTIASNNTASLQLHRTTSATDSEIIEFANGATYAMRIGRLIGSDDVAFVRWDGSTAVEHHRWKTNGDFAIFGKLTSPSTETVIENTGDTFGTVRLSLRNRNNYNGALFENTTLDLVDFIFSPSTGNTQNIRYEHRTGLGSYKSSLNTAGEFEFGAAGNPHFVTGPGATYVRAGKFGVMTEEPNDLIHVKTTGGAGITIESSGDSPRLTLIGSGGHVRIDGGDLGDTFYYNGSDWGGNFAYLGSNSQTWVGGNATGGDTLKEAHKLIFRARYWNGSSSNDHEAEIRHVMESTGPASRLMFKVDNTERFNIKSSGIVNVIGNFVVTGDVTSGGAYYINGSDGLAKKFFSQGNTAPNQDFHFFADHTKQTSGSTNVHFGYNGQIANYYFRSSVSGSHIVPMSINGTNGDVDVLGNMNIATGKTYNINGVAHTHAFTAITGTLGISQGGTGQTTANAALNAFLPTQTGNQRKVLRTSGSNTSWAFAHGNLSTVLVAANNAPAEDKLHADYVCDGVADDVEIQAALDSIESSGGTVLLSAGSFAISTTLIMEGDDTADSVNMSLRGQGNETTKLNGANNTDVILLRKVVKVNIADLQIGVLGTGSGIKSTAKTTDPWRSFWNSSFKNIYVKGDFSAHSGWAFYLEAPFRSTFENIEANGVGNGMYLSATNSNFNPGNCTFTRCFMDLSQANGTGFKLWTPDGGGQFNICTFIQCEAIDSESTSTTSIGFHLRGSSTTYHATKNIFILSTNVEGFNTAVKFEKAIQNQIELNFVNVKNNGTMLSFSSDSYGNDVSILSSYIPVSETNNLFVDANTNASLPNAIRRFEAYVDTGGTLNATATSATVMDRLYPSGPGTIDTDILIGKTRFVMDIEVPDEAYDATNWNGSMEVPTKNAIRDKIESMGAGGMSNPMTTLGDIIYEDATPAAARLAGNTTTTKKFLTQTGNGTISAAPGWNTISAGDVPTLNQNTTGSAATLTTSRNINGVAFNGSADITVTAAAGTLTGTTLNATVVTSSLTAVGTIATGTWSATTIAVNKGGTGQTSYTDGQLLIGNSSGNTLSKSTLTAGSGITITNGGGTITIAASGGGGSGDVVGPASSTDNALARFDSTTGKIVQNSNAILEDSGRLTLSVTSGDGLRVTSSEASGGSANLVYIEATDATFDRPLLRIVDGSTAGGAANIRLDSPNPDIEFVETDQTTPAGKFEIDVNGDKFRINGRNAADNSFEPIITFSRYASGGMVGIGTIYDTPNAMLEIVKTTGKDHFAVSLAVGASSGDIFKIASDGTVTINDTGAAVNLRVESDTNANMLFVDGTNNRVGIGTSGPLQVMHVNGRLQLGFASTTSGSIYLANSGAAGLTNLSPGAPGSDITVTLPAFAGTLATLAGTETFTNKTLSAPVFSGAYSFGGTPTFPTFNQNTTGSAATLTTTRTIWGQNFNGSANVTGTLALGASDLTLTGSIGATGARATKVWTAALESTAMPTVGGTAILTSLTAPQFTTIELGAASDTTLSRSAAGVIAVEGVVIPSISSTNTLTNKRITPRIGTEASSATSTPTADSVDQWNVTALAAADAFAAPSGTPTDGQKLTIRIKDNGTARALTWNAIYRAMGVALPSTTVLGKTLYLGFIYNAADSKWDLVASAQEA